MTQGSASPPPPDDAHPSCQPATAAATTAPSDAVLRLAHLARSRNRNHDGPVRGERIRLRLTSEELAALAAAAHDAGLSVSGYAAEALVTSVTGSRLPLAEPLRSALADLVDARAQLRRLAPNVHLAVASAHRNGTPPPWLVAAVQDAAIAVRHVDQAAVAVVAALPRGAQ